MRSHITSTSLLGEATVFIKNPFPHHTSFNVFQISFLSIILFHSLLNSRIVRIDFNGRNLTSSEITLCISQSITLLFSSLGSSYGATTISDQSCVSRCCHLYFPSTGLVSLFFTSAQPHLTPPPLSIVGVHMVVEILSRFSK